MSPVTGSKRRVLDPGDVVSVAGERHPFDCSRVLRAGDVLRVKENSGREALVRCQ